MLYMETLQPLLKSLPTFKLLAKKSTNKDFQAESKGDLYAPSPLQINVFTLSAHINDGISHYSTNEDVT